MNNKTNRKTESGVSIRVEMIRQLTLVLLLGDCEKKSVNKILL